MRLRFLLIGAILALPLTASAATLLEYDFEGETPGRWEVHKITKVTQNPDGLHIKADNEGLIITSTAFSRPAAAVALTLQATQTMEVALVWKDPSITDEGLISLPFVIHGSEEVQMLDVDLSTSNLWSGSPTNFGIAFPKGAKVVLKKIEFFHWGFFSRIWHGFISFWTFDVFTPHAVNFLWGPWITTNPVARGDMHINDPPLGTSGTWLFFFLLAAAGAWSIWQSFRKGSHKSLLKFLMLFAVIWLFFDLRMGSEVLSYAINDWRYLAGAKYERKFRQHHNFPDVADDVSPILREEPFYFIVGPSAGPYFFSEMRYRTYPSLPIMKTDGRKEINFALVSGRNDVFLGEEGLQSKDELLVAGTGTLMKEFDEYSSLYLFNPLSKSDAAPVQ